MAKSTVNLDKLKEEIDKRKSTQKPSGGGSSNKSRSFINELLESFETGAHTKSVDKIKEVSNKAVDYLKGGGEEKPFKTFKPQPQKQRISEEYYDDNDREKKLFDSFGIKNKQTLADALEERIRGGQNKTIDQGEQPKHLNEQYLNEKIDDRVNDFLINNVGDIFNESIKSIILEYFAKEKIKEVLSENKDLIRESVIGVIKEIQKKKKTT